jgi:hypothetical protein
MVSPKAVETPTHQIRWNQTVRRRQNRQLVRKTPPPSALGHHLPPLIYDFSAKLRGHTPGVDHEPSNTSSYLRRLLRATMAGSHLIWAGHGGFPFATNHRSVGRRHHTMQATTGLWVLPSEEEGLKSNHSGRSSPLLALEGVWRRGMLLG